MMDEDDKEFQCDFTTEDESLLIQLATDAEASQHVASAIDALPARSDFVSGVAKHDDVATEKPEQAVSTAEDSPAARATPLPTSAEAGSPTLKRPLEDPEEVAADQSAAQAEPPAAPQFEDELEDHRSPLQKFRSYPRRPLTVTDLTSGAWCELQYWYTLSRLPGGRRTRTAAMRQGSKVHQKLEEEVHTTVEVQVLSRVDGFGLKLWNFIHGLRTLRDTGLTRELEIWGVLDGNLVNGVIDYLSHDNPNPEFEFELSQEVEEKKPQQAKVTAYFTSSKASSASPAKAIKDGPKTYLADVKTRGSLHKVSNSMLRPAKIQLLLYHRFLSDIAAGKLDFYKIFRRHGLNPDEPFSDAFLAQMASLHEEIVPETPSSSWETIEDDTKSMCSAETEKPDDALRYKSLRELLFLVKREVNLTFPEGAKSMGSMLRVQYIYRDDGREIGHHDFPVSRSVLDEYLKVYMAWWRGERRATGVDIEEAFKCRSCEFAEVCTWRDEMDSNRVRKAQDRIRDAATRSKPVQA